MLRLFKVLRLHRHFQDWDSSHAVRNPMVWRLLRQFFWMLLGAHLVACGAYAVAAAEGFPDDGWVAQFELLPPALAEHAGHERKEWYDRWVACLYWTIMTITTVGYGDIMMKRTSERVYAILCMFLGAVLFAYMMSNVAQLVRDMDATSTAMRQRMDSINNYMRCAMRRAADTARGPAHLSPSSLTLSTQVPRPAARAPAPHPQVLHLLLVAAVHLRRARDPRRPPLPPPPRGAPLPPQGSRHPVPHTPHTPYTGDPLPAQGHDLESSLLQERRDLIRRISSLVACLTPLQAAPGDFVIIAGELGLEMFFIDFGEVEIWSADMSARYRKAASGEFFGEVALLTRERRTANCKAVSYVELWSLSRDDLERLCGDSPEMEEKMQKCAQQRLAAQLHYELQQADDGDARRAGRAKDDDGMAGGSAARR